MPKVRIPSDIAWNLGSFTNCFQDGNVLRSDYESADLILAFLFNNDITDDTNNQTLILNGTILAYPQALENQGIYLQPGSHLSVDNTIGNTIIRSAILYLSDTLYVVSVETVASTDDMLISIHNQPNRPHVFVINLDVYIYLPVSWDGTLHRFDLQMYYA